jgi:hypothetical protein
VAWFYEIRSSSNAVLKRDGGFATQDAATTAGRADAKKMKNSRQPVGRNEPINQPQVWVPEYRYGGLELLRPEQKVPLRTSKVRG